MKRLITIYFLILAIGSFSQEKISPDRPDQTETVYTTPKKFIQTEIGFLKEKSEENNYKILHPTALIKYGISKKVELRLEANYYTDYQELISGNKLTHSLDPVEIGTKVSLWEEKGILPKTSFIGHIGVPILASESFRKEPVPFICRLTFQNSLSEQLSLGYNVGIEGGGQESTSFFYTIAPGIELGDRWYSYIEAFGSFYKDLSVHHIDAGIGYFITKDVMIDASAGYGLGNSDLKNFFGIGCSFRFNTKETSSRANSLSSTLLK